MNNSTLMNMSEPSDKELVILMKEVAVDAKSRALVTKQQLDEKIKQLIYIASQKR